MFGGPGADIPYRPATEPLDALFARLPVGWRPDALAWWAPEYTPLPEGLDACPVPTVALLGGWQMNFWATAGVLEAFDLVVADRPGCRLLATRGIAARPMRMWTFDPALHRPEPGVDRDIDVLYAGALNADLWGERLTWVRRLARLAGRHRVLITTGVYGEAYARLLRRARIVFNRSYRGEMNMRAYEAAAAGSLLFVERGNQETAEVFTDRVHCVFYGEDLEALVDHYLAHEPERAAIARAGHERVQDETAARHLARLLEYLRDLPARSPGRRRFAALPPAEQAWRLGLKAFLCSDAAAWRLAVRTLARAGDGRRTSQLLGTVATILATADRLGEDPTGRLRSRAAEYAARALAAAPGDPIHHLRAGELALGAGDRERARGHLTQAAERAAALGRVPAPSVPFPFVLDRGRLAWDRAAADGDEALAAAAARLVEARARVHLARLANEGGEGDVVVEQLARSSEAFPNLDGNTLALGDVLAAAGAHDRAVDAYREVQRAYPLNPEVTLRLCQALRGAGREPEARAAAEEALAMLAAIPPLAGWAPAFQALLAAPGAREGAGA